MVNRSCFYDVPTIFRVYSLQQKCKNCAHWVKLTQFSNTLTAASFMATPGFESIVWTLPFQCQYQHKSRASDTRAQWKVPITPFKLQTFHCAHLYEFYCDPSYSRMEPFLQVFLHIQRNAVPKDCFLYKAPRNSVEMWTRKLFFVYIFITGTCVVGDHYLWVLLKLTQFLFSTRCTFLLCSHVQKQA